MKLISAFSYFVVLFAINHFAGFEMTVIVGISAILGNLSKTFIIKEYDKL